MEKEAYQKHFELEETHGWFLGRKEAIRIFLSEMLNGNPLSSEKRRLILDVGCGTGGMFRFLETFGKVWGMDLSEEALSYCRQRHLTGRMIQGSATFLPFPNERFDLVTACDLLYHRDVTDDLLALREFHRVCKKGGYLLLTDAAFNFLRGSHDQFFHGIRRYTVPSLTSKLEKSGFFVRRISYMHMILFPLVYLWRRFRQKTNGSDLKPLPPLLNRSLAWISSHEAQCLKFWNLPFGSSLICLSKKP